MNSINPIDDSQCIEVEQRQASELPSEVEQLEPIIRKDYKDYVLATGKPAEEQPAMERVKNMEKLALNVYEEGLTSGNVPFSQRKQVADKVLEITGVIKKDKGSDNGGNTFVFSDDFAKKFLQAASKVSTSLPSYSSTFNQQVEELEDRTPDE